MTQEKKKTFYIDASGAQLTRKNDLHQEMWLATPNVVLIWPRNQSIEVVTISHRVGELISNSVIKILCHDAVLHSSQGDNLTIMVSHRSTLFSYIFLEHKKFIGSLGFLLIKSLSNAKYSTTL